MDTIRRRQCQGEGRGCVGDGGEEIDKRPQVEAVTSRDHELSGHRWFLGGEGGQH